ncbi:MAG TPA: type II toxin-antitoxin system RelE/ParE family toxin [Candidatus Nanoarchaeia archaeon]|nr:type II toxin-antitoxin system RelE/ParE family toxin [Candidatus Nanoarchaeia archaeon]
MVKLFFDDSFEKAFRKIKDQALKNKLIKQFSKIREDPEVGKPMMYRRKGTRELYMAPFRLSYTYNKEEGKVIFLDFYHKDEQ